MWKRTVKVLHFVSELRGTYWPLGGDE